MNSINLQYMPQVIANISSEFNLSRDEVNGQHVRVALIQRVRDLLYTDIGTLKSHLYRIDVDENHLMQALDCKSADDSAVIIADKIIDRSLKKLETRMRYKGFSQGYADL